MRWRDRVRIIVDSLPATTKKILLTSASKNEAIHQHHSGSHHPGPGGFHSGYACRGTLWVFKFSDILSIHCLLMPVTNIVDCFDAENGRVGQRAIFGSAVYSLFLQRLAVDFQLVPMQVYNCCSRNNHCCDDNSSNHHGVNSTTGQVGAAVFKAEWNLGWCNYNTMASKSLCLHHHYWTAARKTVGCKHFHVHIFI